MKICIVGAGVVGSFVAQTLARGNYEVAILDINEALLEKLSLKPNILTLNCDAREISCLEKVKDYDLFVVLTDSDETNLTVAGLIKALNPLARTVVKISRRDYKLFDELLKLQTVDIVDKTAEALCGLVDYPFAQSLWNLGDILIFRKKVALDSVFHNRKLKDLKPLREEVPFTVVLIRRGGQYLIPGGETEIKLGDILYIAVERQNVEKLVKVLKLQENPVKEIFIFGYSKYADRFMEKLNLRKDIKVKFVHPDYKVCEEVSQKYENILAFQGEPTDEELLKAEGIDKTDYVFCLSDNEENNIVLAVFTKNLGVEKNCVLIKLPQFERLVENLKIYSYVLPKKIFVSYIYSYLREENITEVTELEEGINIYKIHYQGEEKPLQKLKLKECNLIIAVEREGKTFIPKGSTLIQKGDYLYCLRIN